MTATTNTPGTTVTVGNLTFEAPRDVEGMRGLFDVEVLSLTCLRLIPRNNLGKSLLTMLLHGTPPKVSLQSRGDFSGPAHLRSRDAHTRRAASIESLELVFEDNTAHLSKGGEDIMQYTAMSLKPDEYDAARKLVDGMRDPTPAKKQALKRKHR